MTYLEAVNQVLRRLREDEVANVSENEYSKLIGDFVNDAYGLCESAWEWSGLETDVIITTADGVQAYELNNTGESVVVCDVYELTQPRMLEEVSSAYIRNAEALSAEGKGVPRYWTIDGLSADREPMISFWPIPDGVYNVSVHVDKSGTILTDGAHSFDIPVMPVVQMAFGLALRERGEAGGQTSQEQIVIAEQFLSDAIARDAKRRPEKTVWRAV